MGTPPTKSNPPQQAAIYHPSHAALPSLLTAAGITTTFGASNAMGCCISKCHPEAAAPQQQKQEIQFSSVPVPRNQIVHPLPSAQDDHIQNNIPSLPTTSSTSSSTCSSRAASASNSSTSSSSCCTFLSTDSPLLAVPLPTYGNTHRQRIVVLDPRRQKQISPDPCPASSAPVTQLRKRPRSGSPALTRQKSLKTGPDPRPQRQTPLSIFHAPSPPVRRPPSPIRRLPIQVSPLALAARKEKLRRSATTHPITRAWGGPWTRPNRREVGLRRVHPQAMSTLHQHPRQLTVVEMDGDDDGPDPRRLPVLEDATISLDCFIFI